MLVILATECSGKLMMMTLQTIGEYQFIIDYSRYIDMSWCFDFMLFVLRGNQGVIRTFLSEERFWWIDVNQPKLRRKMASDCEPSTPKFLRRR